VAATAQETLKKNVDKVKIEYEKQQAIRAEQEKIKEE